jgi:hypothetical protein
MGLTISGSAAGVEAVEQSAEAVPRYTSMHVAFDGGISLDVDLAEFTLTQEQRLAVDKLIDRASRIEDAQCVGDRCPAQDFLDPVDYEKVRGLKASLGTADDLAIAAWVIIDFCIHPLIHKVQA